MTQKHRFKVDKLIRDKLPEIMRKSGIEVFERILEKDEYIKRLKDKLLEEAEEVCAAQSQGEVREELADLLEVMMAVSRINDLTFEEVTQTAEHKKIEKGGFDCRTYNDFVEIASGNPSLGYYKSRPHHYPEIQQMMHGSPKKVMIFGKPGSGKSTFAVGLRDVLNLPLYHLDKYFFEANWIERGSEEFLKVQETILNSDKWIIDGNSIHSLERRYSKADLVLYFNYPTLVCYFRILKRFFNPMPAIDDRAPGCYETIRLSLLRYIWNFEKRVFEQIAVLKNKYPNTPFIEIKNDRYLIKLKNELIGTK